MVCISKSLALATLFFVPALAAPLSRATGVTARELDTRALSDSGIEQLPRSFSSLSPRENPLSKVWAKFTKDVKSSPSFAEESREILETIKKLDSDKKMTVEERSRKVGEMQRKMGKYSESQLSVEVEFLKYFNLFVKQQQETINAAKAREIKASRTSN